MTASAAALIAAVLGLGAPTSQSSAAEPTAGPCAGDEGVTVVVDFGTLGGGVQTRCAKEPVTSGFNALSGAEFRAKVDPRGFLCSIDDLPGNWPSNCKPPSDYYWSYWLAPEPGGEWTYSGSGAGGRDPEPGSVDGWAFVDGCSRKPGDPTDCGDPTTTSTTGAPRTTAGGSGGPVDPGSPSTSHPAPGAAAGSGGGGATTEAGRSTPTTGDDPGDGTSPLARSGEIVGGPREGLAAGTPAESPRSGSPVGALAAAGTVALLMLGAMRRARARRRTQETGAG